MNSIKAVFSSANDATVNEFLGLGWVYLNSVAVMNLTGPTYVLGWDKATEPLYPHAMFKPKAIAKPAVRR